MTQEEAIEFGNMWLQINEDCKDSSTYAFFQMAIEALKIETCDDAISRQNVIETIKELRVYVYNNFPEMINRAALINVVENLSSVQPTQKWIPVSERLPEKNTWVLVTCKSSLGYIYLDIEMIHKYTGLWTGTEDFSGIVLAWMPLPKPYEPQESEDKE